MEWIPKCWSWWLTSNPDGGAIATLGNTGLGMGEHDYEYLEALDGWLFPRFFYHYGQMNIHNIGEAQGLAIADYVHEFDINDDGFNDMQILWGHPFGEPGAQVHEWERRDISFGFCFLQPLPQDETIVLKLGLLAVQYNEWESPCVGPVN